MDQWFHDELSDYCTGDIPVSPVKEGRSDVHPSEKGCILEKVSTENSEQEIRAREVKWGFPSYDNKGLIINARAENIEERRAFSNGIRNKRCIIPVSGFYEWDASGEKVTFTLKDERLFFLGGIYDSFMHEDRFVIITCGANESVKDVHERMPLIIKRDMVDAWFSPDFKEVLGSEMPELTADRKYTQMSIFDF